MSFRLSRTVTPKRLAANRRSALKSTGPRTAAGKSRSRLNALRNGKRSESYDRLYVALLEAPLGTIDQVAAHMLTLEERAHPVFASLIADFWENHDFQFEQTPVFRQQLRRFFRGRTKPKSALESTQV